jgi:hypothetical protein
LSHNKNYIVCLLSLFLTNTNIVFDLSFHFVLMFFASFSFLKCVFTKSHFFVILFVNYQIRFGKFYFLSYIVDVVSVKKI